MLVQKFLELTDLDDVYDYFFRKVFLDLQDEDSENDFTNPKPNESCFTNYLNNKYINFKVI